MTTSPGERPLRRLLPLPAGELPRTPDEAALVDHYLEGVERRWLRATMVAGASGAVKGPDGLSGSIASPADRRVFSVLRSLCDAVFVGAGTVRAERYTRLSAKPAHAGQRRARGQAKVPVLAILTGSGKIDLERLMSAGESPVLLLVGPDAEPARVAEARSVLGADSIVPLPTGAPGEAVQALRAHGLEQIQCEGGPTLLKALHAEPLVDEHALTITPLFSGGDGGGLLRHAPAIVRPARLAGLLESDSTLLTRYLL